MGPQLGTLSGRVLAHIAVDPLQRLKANASESMPGIEDSQEGCPRSVTFWVFQFDDGGRSGSELHGRSL
jgi:hypothetical protein